MTGSWTMDAFIVGSIILLIVPLVATIYEDVIKERRGENNDS